MSKHKRPFSSRRSGKRVFISHTNSPKRDKDFAVSLACALRELGFKVFLDVEAKWAGLSILEKIDDALEECDFFILVLSLRAWESPPVVRELYSALHMHDDRKRHNRPAIVFVMVQDCHDAIRPLSRSIPRIQAYRRRSVEVLKDLLHLGMGLGFRDREVDSAAQLCDKRKQTLARWLTAIAPMGVGNPFDLRRKEKKTLESACNDQRLKQKLTIRLQEFLRISSLVQITVREFQDEVESALIKAAKGSPEQMFRLGNLLFRETARRWMKGDPKKTERMITRADWETALRKAIG